MKKRLLEIKFAAMLVAFVAAANFATAGEGISPEAKKVFDAYVNATGGKDKLEGVKSIRMAGKMSIPAMNMNASMTLIQKSPDLFYLEQIIPGMGKMRQAYDGTAGWASDPMQGFRALEGEELAGLIDDNTIKSNFFLEERYSAAKIVENDKSAGKIAIEAVKKINGTTDTLYFDPKSNLLLSMDSIGDMGPQGKLPVSISLDDYAEFDGVLTPRKMTVNNPAMQIVMEFENVETNIEIPEGQFSYTE